MITIKALDIWQLTLVIIKTEKNELTNFPFSCFSVIVTVLHVSIWSKSPKACLLQNIIALQIEKRKHKDLTIKHEYVDIEPAEHMPKLIYAFRMISDNIYIQIVISSYAFSSICLLHIQTRRPICAINT